MALITKVSGKSYRVCTDAENDAYDELSFKTDAGDVSFTDGTDAETNLSAIKGITSDMSCEDENIAASAKAVGDSLGGLSFAQDADGKWGYKVGASTEIIPFKGGLDERSLLDHFSTLTASKSTSSSSVTLTATVSSSTDIDFTDIDFLKLEYVTDTQNRPKVWANIGDVEYTLSYTSCELVLDVRAITGEQPFSISLKDQYSDYTIGITLNSIIAFTGDVTLGNPVSTLRLPVKTTFYKNSDNANGYTWTYYDVSGLSEITYTSTMSNNVRLRYSLDGGANTNIPSTSGTIDVSGVSELGIMMLCSSETQHTFSIVSCR